MSIKVKILQLSVEPKIHPQDDEVVEVHSNSDVILKCDATGIPLVPFFKHSR